jgi:hypothetical protein
MLRKNEKFLKSNLTKTFNEKYAKNEWTAIFDFNILTDFNR